MGHRRNPAMFFLAGFLSEHNLVNAALLTPGIEDKR